MTSPRTLRAGGAILMLLVSLSPLLPGQRADEGEGGGLRFEIRYGPEQSADALDGRMLLMLSTDDSREPRFQIVDGPATQLAFGVDVEGLEPGQAAAIGEGVLGYPVDSLAELPAGQYIVQALLHRYETFHRADGHTLKLPMDRGEGQQWNEAPGNLYSLPRTVMIDPAAGGVVEIVMAQVIPPIPDPPTTKYIKHERIQSRLLTEFWGRPMFLGAHVLLPEGFDEHPGARYPLAIFHGHFHHDFGRFREEPPDPDLEPEHSERFDWPAYNRTEQAHAHQFYNEWTGPDFPRMIIIEIQHANPYYDDSYAVNSANVGPTATRSPTSSFRTSRRSTAASVRAGPASFTEARRADGRPSECRSCTRRVQRLLCGLPRPRRLPGPRVSRHLRGRERV